jgi:hypothetical protein
MKGGFSHEHYPKSESLKHNAILSLRGAEALDAAPAFSKNGDPDKKYSLSI